MENEGKGCVATRIMGNQLRFVQRHTFFRQKTCVADEDSMIEQNNALVIR